MLLYFLSFSGDRSRNDSDLIVDLVENNHFTVSPLLDDQPFFRRQPGLSQPDFLLARGLLAMPQVIASLFLRTATQQLLLLYRRLFSLDFYRFCDMLNLIYD